jgi:predicted DNA-binding transcriptional regulator AlpA
VDANAIASDSNSKVMARKIPVSISRWVNERYPPLHDLLCAHDVAHLTRRSHWVITGLCLIGRFPRKLKFHGRSIGWRRSEVLVWMVRDLALANDRALATRHNARRRHRRFSLPFKRLASSNLARRGRPRRPSAKRKSVPCNP